MQRNKCLLIWRKRQKKWKIPPTLRVPSVWGAGKYAETPSLSFKSLEPEGRDTVPTSKELAAYWERVDLCTSKSLPVGCPFLYDHLENS